MGIVALLPTSLLAASAGGRSASAFEGLFQNLSSSTIGPKVREMAHNINTVICCEDLRANRGVFLTMHSTSVAVRCELDKEEFKLIVFAAMMRAAMLLLDKHPEEQAKLQYDARVPKLRHLYLDLLGSPHLQYTPHQEVWCVAGDAESVCYLLKRRLRRRLMQQIFDANNVPQLAADAIVAFVDKV